MPYDFCTIIFGGYSGEWVGADRYDDLRAENERLREAIAAHREQMLRRDGGGSLVDLELWSALRSQA